MAIDGFFIKKLKNEVFLKLNNNRLEQIGLVEKDIFSFSFYLRGTRNFLNFKLNSPHASFFISNMSVDKNLKSNFLQNLKRYLESSILKNIEQHSDDRVVIFTFEKVDFLDGLVTYQLVLELMGRYNNLILIKDGIVVDAFVKNISTTNRSIVPNVEFQFFPSNKQTFIIEVLNKITDPLFLTKNYLGFSPLLSKYLFAYPTNFLENPVLPTLNKTTNEYYWFNIFESNHDLIHFDNISNLIVHLISKIYKPNTKYETFITNRLNNYQKRLFKYEEQISEQTNNLNFLNFGNDIYSSGLDLSSYYNQITNNDGEVIKLDISKTLNENAQLFFKKYKKAKRALEYLNIQILETKNLINIFEQFLFDISLDSINHLEISEMLKPYGFKTKNKKVSKKIEPLKIINNENIYYIGLNNVQNEYVTNTIAKANDYWFHIKDLPGSHVVLKGPISDEAISLGAMLALKYSKGFNKAGLVNYTQVKNLKKIPKVPSYNVILKSYQTINITIDENYLEQIFVANKLKKS